MNVLVACEESQVVTIAFRKLGFRAFSCDVQKCSGGRPGFHIQSDVLPFLDGNTSFVTCDGRRHNITGKWDLIIAHPPCTFLSKAGSVRMFVKPKQIDYDRYKNMLAAREFFMRFYNCNWIMFVSKILFLCIFVICHILHRLFSRIFLVILFRKKRIFGLRVYLN